VIAYRFADVPQDRAKHRLTGDYNVSPRLQVGFEYNVAVQEIAPRATWIVQPEDESRPMVFFNTSSDRIGTPEGYQLVSVNAAKTLHGTKLSPYLTVAYSGFDKKLVFPFGASYGFSPRWRATGMNDGRKSHLLVTYSEEAYFIQAAWIWFKHPAVAIGWGF
jgi:hypothetical protein